MKRISLLSIAAALAIGCSNGAPIAEIVGATPESLVAHEDASDDITMVVHYEDPDGDLGQGQVVVIDCRSSSVRSTFAIPQIANPQAVDEAVAIEGDLDVVLTDVGVVDAGPLPAECAEAGASAGAFCVVLIDAAGNPSAPACTGAIVVEP